MRTSFEFRRDDDGFAVPRRAAPIPSEASGKAREPRTLGGPCLRATMQHGGIGFLIPSSIVDPAFTSEPVTPAP